MRMRLQDILLDLRPFDLRPLDFRPRVFVFLRLFLPPIKFDW